MKRNFLPVLIYHSKHSEENIFKRAELRCSFENEDVTNWRAVPSYLALLGNGTEINGSY